MATAVSNCRPRPTITRSCKFSVNYQTVIFILVQATLPIACGMPKVCKLFSRISSFFQRAAAMKVTCWTSHPCLCRALLRPVLNESYCASAIRLALASLGLSSAIVVFLCCLSGSINHGRHSHSHSHHRHTHVHPQISRTVPSITHPARVYTRVYTPSDLDRHVSAYQSGPH
jgi:hypothetical protein